MRSATRATIRNPPSELNFAVAINLRLGRANGDLSKKFSALLFPPHIHNLIICASGETCAPRLSTFQSTPPPLRVIANKQGGWNSIFRLKANFRARTPMAVKLFPNVLCSFPTALHIIRITHSLALQCSPFSSGVKKPLVHPWCSNYAPPRRVRVRFSFCVLIKIKRESCSAWCYFTSSRAG